MTSAEGASGLEVRRAGPADEAGILALAAQTLGWGEDERFAELYRWKHDRNPFGSSPRWVAVDDGTVVGFRVLLRWRFGRGDSTTVDAVRAVDTATAPSHQGRGIFRRLTTIAVDELRDEGVHFVFNTPNEQSRPGYLRMGWIELGRPPMAVVPRLTSVRKIARARASAELWSTPTDAGVPALSFFERVEIHDLLGRQRADPGIWRTDRTPEFMQWRYGLEPLHYRVLSTEDLGIGGPLGAIVFRLRRRGDAMEAAIVDVLATDPTQRRKLVRAVRPATGADYALLARHAVVDPALAVPLPNLGPLVTWRSLAMTREPVLAHFAFSLGDLELF